MSSPSHAVIRLGTFTPSVLLDVARSTGMLDHAEVDVQEISVASSPAQFAALRSGELDVVFTSPDNVIAYDLIPSNPLGEILDVEILAALDRGQGLTIGVRPGISSITELAGLRFGVDVPQSGFALAAFELLARNGLDRGDYEVVTLGSTPRRAAALLNGGCDATILNAGNELRARAAGCSLLAAVTDLGPYLGTVVARLRTGTHPEAADRLVTALIATSSRILGAELHAETLESTMSVLHLDDALAAEHLAVLADPRQGLIPDGRADRAAFVTLLDLRHDSLSPADEKKALAAIENIVRPGMLVA